MKKIFLLIGGILCMMQVSAQTLSSEMKNALKSDDAAELKKWVTSQNINECFQIEDKGYNLLSLCIKTNARTCFNMLLTQKVNLERICEDKTPLMYAVKYGRLDMVKSLVQQGADVHKTVEQGKTALYYAKKYEHKEIEEYLRSFALGE